MVDIILTKDVRKLGKPGDVVRVRPGFARNYLLPRGLALTATQDNIALLEHRKREIAAEQARIRAEHDRLAAALKNAAVSIARKKGNDDRLFGSVNNRDIAEALAAQNIQVDRKFIRLEEPIRTVGTHKVEVRFSADVMVELAVNVVGI